ncbi:MAG: 4'-phosphopantetheinyl transferase superfamily protein [Lachnospiraceae bacterium]|nr:4'-phosphopantetheinyl transferase superfamily protein [Lachnospiraceae bacterium]
MIHLYAADIADLPDPGEDPALLDELDPERKCKVMRYLKAEDRIRSLGAGLLLNRILPRYGVSPAGIRIGADGKPEVDGICFNLSHSGHIVICATAEKEVGCDVEEIVKAPEGVVEHFFHPSESAYVNACTGEERDHRFFRVWTMKESYIKMTGEGMSLDFDRFEFLLDPEKIKVRRDGKLLSCRIMEYDIPGYKVSVCANEEEFSGHVEYVSLKRSRS